MPSDVRTTWLDTRSCCNAHRETGQQTNHSRKHRERVKVKFNAMKVTSAEHSRGPTTTTRGRVIDTGACRLGAQVVASDNYFPVKSSQPKRRAELNLEQADQVSEETGASGGSLGKQKHDPHREAGPCHGAYSVLESGAVYVAASLSPLLFHSLDPV